MNIPGSQMTLSEGYLALFVFPGFPKQSILGGNKTVFKVGGREAQGVRVLVRHRKAQPASIFLPRLIYNLIKGSPAGDQLTRSIRRW